MRNVLLACLVVSLFLASALITLPLPLVFLFLLSIFERKEWVFAVAFVSGIIIDGFWMQHIGMSSLFFVTFLCVVELYERKFELLSIPFILVFSFGGSFLYLLLFVHRYSLPAAIMAACVTLVMFLLCKRFGPQEQQVY